MKLFVPILIGDEILALSSSCRYLYAFSGYEKTHLEGGEFFMGSVRRKIFSQFINCTNCHMCRCKINHGTAWGHGRPKVQKTLYKIF